MFLWWETLTTLEKAFYFIAIPSTVVMILQTVLLVFGVGDDVDSGDLADGDALPSAVVTGNSTVGSFGDIEVPEQAVAPDIGLADDHHLLHVTDVASFRLFSLRGVLSFLVVFGWVGIAMVSEQISPFIVISVSFVAGVLALYLTAWMIYGIQKLQSSGNISLQDAVGKMAEVYIPIPAAQAGCGKVNLLLQERWLECDAVTKSHQPLQTGSAIRVVGIQSGSILVVEPAE